MKGGTRKLKNFMLSPEACEILSKMKAKTSKPEAQIVEDLIRRADQILTPVESNPILAAIRDLDEKVSELLSR